MGAVLSTTAPTHERPAPHHYALSLSHSRSHSSSPSGDAQNLTYTYALFGFRSGGWSGRPVFGSNRATGCAGWSGWPVLGSNLATGCTGWPIATSSDRPADALALFKALKCIT